MRFIWCTVLLFTLQLTPALAEQIYTIDILPAQSNAAPYQLTCSMEKSPCSVKIKMGTKTRPDFIEARVSVLKRMLEFDFMYKEQLLSTKAYEKTALSIRTDFQVPVLVDLYLPDKSAENDLSLYAVVRPTGKFITSLQISPSRHHDESE